MTRKVFTSFHYVPDNWRASQVRSIGKIEGNPAVTANKWEEVTNGGDKAIEKWINDNMYGKSCVVLLVGANTANRKWIDYEIKKAWSDGKGIVGIHVHNLLDSNSNQSSKGKNPFAGFNLDGVPLSEIVKCYDPPYSISTKVYNHIRENIEDWIEEAITIRNRY
ncbi:TIR domain-containing protein [Chryseobacterium sp. M5A1_1a]